MKTRTILSSLKHVALSFTMIVLAGAGYVVSAQKGNPTASDMHVRMDFNGDGKVDIVFASATSDLWIIQSLDETVTESYIGSPGNRPVAADYDGDRIEDLAVASEKAGQIIWRIQRSSDRREVEIYWGLKDDTLVPGDYDGDGMADVAVWRSSEGMWYILSSKSGEVMVQHFGDSTDKAMPGDYDGDGIMDVCVFRPKSSSFFYYTSTSDLIHEVVFGPFLMNSYQVFVPADYDGDRITDFATYDATNGGVFVILESSTGKYSTASLQGGGPTCGQFAPEPCAVVDFPLPADYDHDGRVDPAVWDSKNKVVTAMGSTEGHLKFSVTSLEDMIPVSSFFMTK